MLLCFHIAPCNCRCRSACCPAPLCRLSLPPASPARRLPALASSWQSTGRCHLATTACLMQRTSAHGPTQVGRHTGCVAVGGVCSKNGHMQNLVGQPLQLQLSGRCSLRVHILAHTPGPQSLLALLHCPQILLAWRLASSWHGARAPLLGWACRTTGWAASASMCWRL